MPPRPMQPHYQRPKPPKSIGDLPRYLSELFGGFFKRFFYIVKLVWQTGHWIPIMMSVVALFRGVTPVIGSLISRNILNELQTVIKNGFLPESAFWSSGILYLLIALFVYRLLILVVNNISSGMNRIAGEKVVNQVKQQIMDKRPLITPPFMKNWKMPIVRQDTVLYRFSRKPLVWLVP